MGLSQEVTVWLKAGNPQKAPESRADLSKQGETVRAEAETLPL